MKLSKFPVTTKRGEYLITIEDVGITVGRMLKCRIYVRNRKRSLHHPFKFRFVWRRHEDDTLGAYDDWVKDIKGFAIYTVNEYEEYLEEVDIENTAIKEFKEWDGIVGD